MFDCFAGLAAYAARSPAHTTLRTFLADQKTSTIPRTGATPSPPPPILHLQILAKSERLAGSIRSDFLHGLLQNSSNPLRGFLLGQIRPATFTLLSGADVREVDAVPLVAFEVFDLPACAVHATTTPTAVLMPAASSQLRRASHSPPSAHVGMMVSANSAYGAPQVCWNDGYLALENKVIVAFAGGVGYCD